jgi:methionine-rich copper-binding protein CopC
MYILNWFGYQNRSNFNRVANDCCTPVLVPLRKTSEEGAYTSVHVATSPDLEGVSGQYFFHCQAVPTG